MILLWIWLLVFWKFKVGRPIILTKEGVLREVRVSTKAATISLGLHPPVFSCFELLYQYFIPNWMIVFFSNSSTCDSNFVLFENLVSTQNSNTQQRSDRPSFASRADVKKNIHKFDIYNTHSCFVLNIYWCCWKNIL